MDRITDRPDMTSAVDRGRNALIQQKKGNILLRHEGEVCSYDILKQVRCSYTLYLGLGTTYRNRTVS